MSSLDKDLAERKQNVTVIHHWDWRPPGVRRCLAASPSHFVGLMEDGCSVLKYPVCKDDADAMQYLREEAARFEHLGSHPNLLVFKGPHEHGLIFEYCERGDLQSVLWDQPNLSDEEKKAISEQIIRGLIHLHAHRFIHCDLRVDNVFVTSSMVAKIGDIQGQLYRADGTIEMSTMCQENPKSRHPFAGDDDFSPQTDIFALGTLLYYLWHGHPPFPELEEVWDEEEIQARYRKGEFPISKSPANYKDKIIRKCWDSEYQEVADVLRDMEIQ